VCHAAPSGEAPPARRVELIYFDSSEALARAAAARWLAELSPARRQTVALSGGRIAKTFFAAIVRLAKTKSQPFANLHFFWADERCVPPDQADSNFALARAHLLEPLGIPAEPTHRVLGELEPSAAAAKASAELGRIAACRSAGQPILDWVFLGMGEDGHVASLFPGMSDSAAEVAPAYLAVTAPKPPPGRITLSYPALAAARQIWVLVSGPGKERALAESRSPTGQTPLARVVRSRGSTLIFSEVRLCGDGPKKD
jgi:6-phosphogluconolactonase